MASAPPYFIVGSERSGTTLLRLLLDYHPRLACHSEFEYIVDTVPAAGGWPDLSAYYEYLELNRVFQHDGFAIDRALSYPELVKSFLEQKRARDSKPVVGATVHRHFDLLPRIWPEACYIHLLRDPRDVARSAIGMGWAGNVYMGVEIWIEAQDAWERLAQQVPADRYIEVRYEDLVQNPPEHLTRICAFLGVDYDEAMYRYTEHTSYKAPDPKLSYQWKRKLTEEEIRLVELRIRDRIQAGGYELSGLPALEVTPQRLQQLKRQDRWGRRKHGIQRYGLGVILTGFLARRLGLKGLEKAVQRRRNAINMELNK